jgi:hypothetical protein
MGKIHFTPGYLFQVTPWFEEVAQRFFIFPSISFMGGPKSLQKKNLEPFD